MNQKEIKFYITLLLRAARDGNYYAVLNLITDGFVDANSSNSNGQTALMAASLEGHERIVRFLLKNGANPDRQNKLEFTALMMASLKGHANVVEELLEHGADSDIKLEYRYRKYEFNALFYATDEKIRTMLMSSQLPGWVEL